MDIARLNLRHLRAFVETVRLGRISAAADVVHVSQPALTQGLAKLEAQLGQRLFDRQPGGMVATPEAGPFAARVSTALAQINSHRVTMTQLHALIALATHGSYAEASLATALSQPALHRAIQDLTIALGKSLVERRGRGVMLTEAGRRVVRGFRLARAGLMAGLSELEALRGREVGRIAIGAMPLSRARLLPAAVATFHRAYPEVDLVIVEGAHAELIEPLRDGELDLLIGALRDPSPGDDIVQTPVFEDHPVIIGRNAHPLQDPTINELAAYPWIVSGPLTPLRGQWEKMFRQAGVAVPHVPIECGSVITIRQILLQGDYLTMLSADQVRVELEAGWLRIIGDTPDGLTRTIGITTRTGWTPTRIQQAFLSILQTS
jgi:DNA-binding transcriptional LysR family regulator